LGYSRNKGNDSDKAGSGHKSTKHDGQKSITKMGARTPGVPMRMAGHSSLAAFAAGESFFVLATDSAKPLTFLRAARHKV